MEGEKHIRRDDRQTDGFNEAVAVLRREKDGEVETLAGVERVEVARGGIQVDPCALAPDLSRLRHVLQRGVEDAIGLLRPEHPTRERTRRRRLVDEVDVAGPQSARADVAAQRADVQLQRARVLFLERQLLHALQQQLPLGGEAEDAVVEESQTRLQRVAAVLHLAVLQKHRVARLRGRDAVAALEELSVRRGGRRYLAADGVVADERDVAAEQRQQLPAERARTRVQTVDDLHEGFRETRDFAPDELVDARRLR